MRIIVTGLGGPAGTALARQLAARGIHVIGTDIVPTPTAELVPEFVLGPRADDAAHLPFLRHLAASSSADLLIPTVQDELPAVAAAAPVLGVPTVISPAGPVGIAQDKLLTAWCLEAAGLPIPRTGTLGTESWARPPFVVKPRVSRGGRGVLLVDGAAHLPPLTSRDVVQDFAPGTEYSPQVYRSQMTGRTAVVVLEKTALKQGRVGNAAAVERLAPGEAPDVAALAAAAVEAIGLVGPVDLDIRRMADGRPVVLEVNARFGANSEHAPELLAAVLGEYAPSLPAEGVLYTSSGGVR
ncbi:MAG TPA: ATP-grasp domain-containing protein [Actinomycetales bacterium]|nr:ATP-grasp domain-containing protein [Actinomycetales bacterium]